MYFENRVIIESTELAFVETAKNSYEVIILKLDNFLLAYGFFLLVFHRLGVWLWRSRTLDSCSSCPTIRAPSINYGFLFKKKGMNFALPNVAGIR